MKMPPNEIAALLREGKSVSDNIFDVWLPEYERSVSRTFWTSVGVATLAAQWLESRGVTHVLDIGSGAGKFCVVGALASELNFVGIEHRPQLVSVAVRLAERFEVASRTRFMVRVLGAGSLPEAGALYFYNPFDEVPFPRMHHIDQTVEIGRRRFTRDVAAAEDILRALAVGTYVVTYNSFGGRVPDTFDLVRSMKAGVNLLRLWRKARVEPTGCYWVERAMQTVLFSAVSSALLEVIEPEPNDGATGR